MADLFQFQKTGFKLSRKVETSIWAVKLVLVCVGIVSTVIFIKVALLPYTFNLILSTLPPFWISPRSLLSPLHVYIILNLIIITIAASSQTQSHSLRINNNNNNNSSCQGIEEEEEEEEEGGGGGGGGGGGKEKEMNPSFFTDKPIDDPSKQTSYSGEKEPEKIACEGLEVVEEEEETLVTLEDTWRLIMEGKGNIKERQLKKSGTWDTPPRVVVSEEEVGGDDEDNPVAWARREMRKSDTFNDRVTLLKRKNIHKKSMTKDELTQRSEAFIKNFNNDMRMQRQESEQLFMEIINRGV